MIPLMERIDLNADVGESFGPYVIGNDERMFRHVTSANIACGSHGGDPSVMRRTVRLAVARGVSPGAHPGYADLMGFGRRDIAMDPQELEDLVVYQVGALAGMAAAEGTRLEHVKPHGALYNRAARDRPLADAIARAVRAVDARLILFGGSGSRLVEAGDALGLHTAAEVFADRAYRPDGSLAPRREPGAVITDPAAVAERALRLVRSGEVATVTGEVIALRRDTICLHGDTPGAGDIAAAVRARLEGAGVRLAPVGSEGRRGDGGTSP